MSGHGVEPASGVSPVQGGALGALDAALRGFNWVIVALASLALLAASVILSYSVVARYFWKIPTYWQDEAAVFLLVGATFMSTGFVQQQRGHVAIGALVSVLPSGVNRVRAILVDLASLAFCAFFAWKSFGLLHEAWVDGQVSSSTWAPPMWIPYSLMALGMTLLCLQLALQVGVGVSRSRA